MQCVSGAGAGAEELGGVLGHAPAAGDLVAMDLAGAGGELTGVAAGGTQLAEGPREVDRRGTRGGEGAGRLVEILAARGGERVAVGGGDPDRRSAADRERPDRVGDLGRGAAGELRLLVGKPPLVEQDDAVRLEPEDVLGCELRSSANGAGHRLPRGRAEHLGYVPSSHEARYFACSSVRRSISTSMLSSFRRAISLSISSGTS